MNKKLVSLLCSVFFLASCSRLVDKKENKNQDVSSVRDDQGKISEPIDRNTDILDNPNTKYDPSVLLVKTSATSDSDVLTKDRIDLGITSINPIAPRSEWKKAKLEEELDAKSSIKKFRNSKLFDRVDFDYIYDTDEVEGSEEGTTSTIPIEVADYQKQIKLDKAYQWREDNGHQAGGESSVVVAVIDTGIDYNHIDLKQNIWINKGEIPHNGIDDDGNGYVDDVYGWNFVGNNNDPMDDNGHGTHVAGIIGAANNDIGVTGVAYNCKIMPIKAANSSGYLNNSDIASAITYAYRNGADVINRSFGCTSVTRAVQEALEKAYTTSFLVAAAGNDGLPNEYAFDYEKYETIYPASYSFVDGVRSVDANNVISGFTNWDAYKENKIEYECFAPGEEIESTFPDNRYARLSGTSMATPVVSGIAALLRSSASDKKEYPNNYLMSQIINSSATQPYGKKWNGKAMVIDALKRFTDVPKPDVTLYDWYTFDGTNISSKNNGNDNIDAGETIHIGTELRNRGGMAKYVTATVDVNRNGATDVVDPYVTITTPTIKFSDIGTYSIRDAGKIRNSDTIVDVHNPFVFEVAENVPNDYKCDINIHISWKNGLDSNDTVLYSKDDIRSVTFHQGEALPSRIDSNTTLTADKLWIVNDTVRIGEGVTVTVEPGTTIQFYEQNQGKYQYASPKIATNASGKLICNGTKENRINFTLANGYESFVEEVDAGIDATYTNFINLLSSFSGCGKASYCHFDFKAFAFYEIDKGIAESVGDLELGFSEITKSNIYINNVYYRIDFHGQIINCCFDFNKDRTHVGFQSKKVEKCLFLFSNTNTFGSSKWDASVVDTSGYLNLSGNAFVNNSNSKALQEFPTFESGSKATNNTFYGYPKPFVDRTFGDTKNEITGTSSIDSLWPFVSGYQFTNDKGEETKKFSKENRNLKLIFNRPMNTSEPLWVRFGSVEPYADYVIEGKWIDESTWQGKCQIPTAIENGTQHLNISGGRAKDDHFLTNEDNGYRITFDIDTTSAMARNRFAKATKEGIQLEMKQDDYDTIMGYNVYRSETKDGEYSRINTSVIYPEDKEQNATYLDTTVEPGKTYYYSYTAVRTDFSESHASGRTACTALDTIEPAISHTPVNQGYLGTNLNINCIIRDNVRVDYAKLYYRVKGSEEYKYVDRTNANDKYSGIIPAKELSLSGMEYYIETSDGTNAITLGTKKNPYQVTIKESSAVSYLGDVDGNGVIEAVDAMLVLQHINGKRVLVNDEFRRADLDGNGKLESFEALAILQYVNGNRTNLEV